jgi:hypothetical protein
MSRENLSVMINNLSVAPNINNMEVYVKDCDTNTIFANLATMFKSYFSGKNYLLLTVY